MADFTTLSATKLEQFTVTLSDDNTTDEHIHTMRYEAIIRLSDGQRHRMSGDLMEHLTQNQTEMLKSLLASLTGKAARIVDSKAAAEPAIG